MRREALPWVFTPQMVANPAGVASKARPLSMMREIGDTLARARLPPSRRNGGR